MSIVPSAGVRAREGLLHPIAIEFDLSESTGTEMNHATLIGPLCAAVFGVITLPTQAALNSVLGGQAYYDDVADITWLAHANATGTTMTWYAANAWAAGLDINGVTGWRLPDTLQPDASCSNQASDGDYGYNCTGSEMGNLFYHVLGGTAGASITTTHNSNYDLFSNVQSGLYWSSLEYAPYHTDAWFFDFSRGLQDVVPKGFDSYLAWAVHSGNAGAVPVPATVWLFGSGLLAFMGINKQRRSY